MSIDTILDSVRAGGRINLIIGKNLTNKAQNSINKIKDNDFNVIVGQRKNSKSWDKAINDGWIEGKNLFCNKQKGTTKRFL